MGQLSVLLKMGRLLGFFFICDFQNTKIRSYQHASRNFKKQRRVTPSASGGRLFVLQYDSDLKDAPESAKTDLGSAKREE